MSNQSPTANSRDQQGRDISGKEQPPPAQDESGFSTGTDEQRPGAGNERPRPSTDIEQTDDPSKD